MFFADDVEEVEGKMDVVGGGWRSARLPTGPMWLVFLCEVGADDAGGSFTVHAFARSPNGDEIPWFTLEKPIPVETMFVALRMDGLPAEPGLSGRYVYRFTVAGAELAESVVVPINGRWS